MIDDDECAFCAAAQPTDLDILFEAVNACLDGAQLSPYENFSEMTIKDAKLDLRRLLDLLTNDNVVDLHVNKESEDYKLLLHAYEHGTRVVMKGKTKEKCLAILGRKPAKDGQQSSSS